jgi:hypothetical protein
LKPLPTTSSPKRGRAPTDLRNPSATPAYPREYPGLGVFALMPR